MAASSLPTSSFVMPRAAVPLDFSDINWTVRELLGIVSEVTGVTVRDLRADRRCKDLVRARHIACWLSRNFTLLNHRTIGRHIGDRDHTTILYALGRVEAVRAHHGIAFVEDPAAMARALWAVAWPRYQR